MKKHFAKSLSLLLAVLMLASCFVLPSSAATYRAGGQSGPSSSYKSSRYYSNYLQVPITGDGRTDVLAMALSQMGYQEGASAGNYSGEVSGGNNYTEYNYNLGAGLGLGYGGSDFPWCASFVSWSLYQSRNTDQADYRSLGRYHTGDTAYIWKEISCSQWVSQLKKGGYYKTRTSGYTPKYGDQIFFRNYAHIGLVVYVSGSTVYTIEGNTSDAAGLEANGGGVYFKSYSLSSTLIDGYGVLPYKTNSSVAKIDYSGANPTAGLYIANGTKYLYKDEACTTRATYNNGVYVNIPRFYMFEVSSVSSNKRALKVTYDGVSGYVKSNNADSDKSIQLSSSASAGSSVPEATVNALKTAMNKALAISHTDYSEGTLINIRYAYNSASVLLNNSSANEDAYKAAIENLNALLADKADNKGGVYLSGVDTKVTEGDCIIFTPNHNYNSSTNTGTITVANANIAYTKNVVLKWNSTQYAWVVDSISHGEGSGTPDIVLESDEILIACHSSNGDAASNTNYNTLSTIEVGQKISFFGADIWGTRPDNYYCKLNIASYFRFDDPSGVNLVRDKEYTISGNGTYAGNYDADLTDGNANGEIGNMAHSWFGFSADADSNTVTDSSTNYKYGYVDFDLGEEYEVNRVRVHLANIAAAGVSEPWKLTFAVSDSPDGPFTECGSWIPTVQAVDGTETTEYAYWAELDNVKGFTGRYVRIIIGVTGYWAFLDEIEIYGTHEGNVAYGKDYSIVSGDKQVFGNGELEAWFSRSAELLDGAFANADELGYDNWFVFFRQEDWLSNDGYDTVDNVETIYDTDGTTVRRYEGAIVIDLGREYNITGFNVHHLGNTTKGNFTPYGFGINASNTADGGYGTTAAYADAGQTHDGIWTTQTDEGYWTGKTTGLSLTGRYVCITADFNSTWLFMNELEIFGTPVSTGCGDGNHIWNSGVVTTAPTCKQTGVRTYTCTECDETKTENIPVLTTHTPGEWKTVTEATETADGLRENYCTECGKLVTSEVISANGRIIYGDTNLSYNGTNENGAVNIADCILIKRNILKTYDFNANQFLRADINEDGKINISDYILCKRIILKTYSK